MSSERISRVCPLCRVGSPTLYAKSNIRLEALDAFAFAARKYPEHMHYDLKLCGDCGILYSDNVLPPSTVAKEYESAAYDSSEEAGFAARTYAKYVPADLKRGKALDIGTGGGEFLGQLKRLGFAPLEGVEPSQAPIDTAASDIKPLIKKGMFDPAQHIADSYDLITCFQTLEHVEDPLRLVKDIHGLLRQGGAFFTIAHNYKSTVNRLLGLSSPIYDIEHYQVFSQEGLYNLLHTTGFTQIRIFAISNTYPLHYWLKLLPVPKKVASTLVNLSKKLRIGYIPVPIRVGNMGAIAFRE